MTFSLKMEVTLIVIGLISLWVGLINGFLYMRYLKKHKPLIYNSLENKRSLIKLPIFMNLDLKRFWKYNFNFMKEKDRRIKLHKIICLVTAFFLITTSIILFANPWAW